MEVFPHPLHAADTRLLTQPPPPPAWRVMMPSRRTDIKVGIVTLYIMLDIILLNPNRPIWRKRMRNRISRKQINTK